MSDDRADEIARGITGQIMLWGPIAAALSSYGREMADAKLDHVLRYFEIKAKTGDTFEGDEVERVAGREVASIARHDAEFVRSLRSEAQDTQTQENTK